MSISIFFIMSRDNSVSIVIRYGLDGQDSDPCKSVSIFLLHYCVRNDTWVLPVQRVLWAVSPGCKVGS
jgi:hypothetical protein